MVRGGGSNGFPLSCGTYVNIKYLPKIGKLEKTLFMQKQLKLLLGVNLCLLNIEKKYQICIRCSSDPFCSSLLQIKTKATSKIKWHNQTQILLFCFVILWGLGPSAETRLLKSYFTIPVPKNAYIISCTSVILKRRKKFA